MTYIKGFNGLRAISVILVVLTHLDMSDWIPNTEFVMQRVWPLISGDFGVLIFFVLSGFLITRILLREYNTHGTINLKNFFARRFLRLAPPLLIFFLLLGIARSFGHFANSFDSILYAVFYLYNFVPREIYSVEMGHFWSLGVEEQFYLLWPFTLRLIPNQIGRIIFVLILMTLCCCLLLIYQDLSINEYYFVKRWFIPASLPILTGCLAALLIHHKPKHVQHFIEHPASTIVALFFYGSLLLIPQGLLVLAPLFLSITVSILLLKVYHCQHSWWVNILEFKLFAFIGIISYGIYVYQGFFLRTGGGSELWFQQFPTNIVFTLTLSIVSYYMVERPILQLKRFF